MFILVLAFVLVFANVYSCFRFWPFPIRMFYQCSYQVTNVKLFLSNRCEPYTGTVCKKYVKNELIYVEPQSPPDQLEGRMQIAFSLMPNYLSERCKPYAFHALCLYAFSPCDKTVNYTKSRKFCQDECKALEQHICANEFDIGRQSMGKFVPNCSRLPAPGSKEHNNCISLNVKSKCNVLLNIYGVCYILYIFHISAIDTPYIYMYVIYTTWAAVLYQIYKHEPKTSGCISDTTQTRMLYIAYDTPTSKCSCLLTILKIFARNVKPCFLCIGNTLFF